MNGKIEHINRCLQEEISYVINNEVKNNDIKFVTITAVKTTTDLSFAKVYFTILNEEYKNVTLKALDKASGFIRTKLFDRIELRHMPKLEFVYDDSIAYSNNIEKKIEEINKKGN